MLENMAEAKRPHPKAVGDASQAMVLARLVQVYPEVLVPFGENCRYDLVIDDGKRFMKVQCKTGRLKDGAVKFPTCSVTYHHPNNRGMIAYRHHYREQIDLFGVYCPETDGVYLVPVGEVGLVMGSLRIEPTKNNQTKKVRWVREFEVASAGLAQSGRAAHL